MKLTHYFRLLACVVAQAFLASHASATDVSKDFAQVWRISGGVTATSGQPAQVRGLRSGDTVYVGEQLQAAAQGEAVLRVVDGGYLALRPGAQFVVEDFAADKSSSDHMTLRLVQGGLRVITGWISKLNPKGYRLNTPSASIGVRGTDHDAYFLTDAMALAWSQKSGTYDKVASGQTYLQTPDGSVDIAPGQVGFVRVVPAVKTRALITLLLPVILDKVPDFFVPGQFDAELDQLSPSAIPAQNTQTTPPVIASALSPPPAPMPGAAPAQLPDGSCNAAGVAQAWLGQLDGALASRDAPRVVGLFASDVKVQVVLTDAAGIVRISLGGEEFASGALAAIMGLSDYSQRRLSVSAKAVNAGSSCDAVSVTSVVLEQGKQNGKPYRFETLEEYQLMLVKGEWRATKASARQL